MLEIMHVGTHQHGLGDLQNQLELYAEQTPDSFQALPAEIRSSLSAAINVKKILEGQ